MEKRTDILEAVKELSLTELELIVGTLQGLQVHSSSATSSHKQDQNPQFVLSPLAQNRSGIQL